MLRDEDPSELEGRIMDICLLLHAEHGFCASTCTARVVAWTLATCYCSVSAAIGALSGPLHGGANEKAMDMVDEIGDKKNVGTWLDKALKDKQKVMGMGHRVYKSMDPRAVIMKKFLEQLSDLTGDHTAYEILSELEKRFRERMEEKGKPLYPNVDFFSGAVYTLLGIPRKLFTPVFAVGRVPGWLAHILEQRKDNRIYRPKCLYVGTESVEYIPMENRS